MQMRDYLSRNNSVLNCSKNDSENNSKRTIPKAENFFKHKYNQAECLSITTRGYIANNISTEVRHWGSNVKSLKQRSKTTEVKELAPAGTNSED